MTAYHATSIQWDIEDHEANPDELGPFDLGLPEDAVIHAADPEDIPDLLSDEYGWCVLHCEYEPIDSPDPMELAKRHREDRLTEGG